MSVKNTVPYPFVLWMIKPDAVRRHLTGEILAAIEAEGFEVTMMRMVGQAEKADVVEHYADHRGKDYFKRLVDTIVGRRVVVGTAVYLADYDKTVERFRALMGPYREPRKGSLRGDFALSELENSIHGSDSPEAALRETLIWFPDQ